MALSSKRAISSDAAASGIDFLPSFFCKQIAGKGNAHQLLAQIVV